MSILDVHDPESWRFYRYGQDSDGEPLFSFWMNLDPDTGVCIYDRSGESGMWLSTHHDEEEYEGKAPSDELKEMFREIVGTGGYVDGDRVESLPDYERYFFQVVYGTLEKKGKVPEELMAFISEVAGTELRIVEK